MIIFIIFLDLFIEFAKFLGVLQKEEQQIKTKIEKHAI